MGRLKISGLAVFAFASLWLMATEDPKALVNAAVEKVGGLDRLYELKDVEYLYTYKRTSDGKKDVSIERYIFDGELSWAKYTEVENNPAWDGKEVIQAYNGKDTWVTINGEESKEPGDVRRSDFLRKTNYYWFAMMFKLADPGTYHRYEGTQQVEGIDYHLVRLSFEEGIGDVQDTYLLYINPYTGLVDQFLFTVMDFDVKDPLLMKVDYVAVDGVMLPASRRYIRSDWQGGIPEGEAWVLEMMQDIKFNNGFKPSDFAKP
jgi:hypothetical protein